MRSVIRALHVRIHIKMAGMALEHLAVFLELIFVEVDELGGGVVRLILQGNHLQPEAKALDVHVGALVFAIGLFLPQAGPRIDRKAHVSLVGAFAHMNTADGRVDVDLLVFPVLLLLHVHAASGQEQSGKGREPYSERAYDLRSSSAHVETLLWRLAPGVRDRRRAGQHSEW